MLPSILPHLPSLLFASLCDAPSYNILSLAQNLVNRVCWQCQDSLEISSGDLIQVMPGWCVELGCCIFSRDDQGEGHISSSVPGFVAFAEELRASGVTP